MMKTKKIKNLKPTEINIHFKYTCPECGIDHWLSLNEAKSKDYLMVCDCQARLKAKPIKSIQIIYLNKKKTKGKTEKEHQDLPVDLLESCVKILVEYGYSSVEAKSLVEKSYLKNPTDNALVIIKDILTTIGGSHG